MTLQSAAVTTLDLPSFIQENLPLTPVPSVPEIRLHTAHPGSGLRRLERQGKENAAPYWAYPWAGGAALARYILDRPQSVRGRRVLDLGAGSGLVAIAAAKADVYNSPGWRRMQARAGARGTSQPQEARTMVIDATAVAAFEVGTRVFHQKFGYGTVAGVEGDKLAIEFEKAGRKNIVARFVMAADEVPF